MMTMPATPGDFFCSRWIGLIKEFGWIPLCAHSIAAFLGVWEKEDLHYMDLSGVGFCVAFSDNDCTYHCRLDARTNIFQTCTTFHLSELLC